MTGTRAASRRGLWLLLAASLLLAAIAPAGAAEPQNWVIYSTEFGWLRVGTLAEFGEKWQKSQEIWGGQSSEPLEKTLIRGGFETRGHAIKALCAELTRVRLKHNPMATPRWTTNALYDGKEYNLRLDRGMDPDAVIWRGEEYDLDAEFAVLRQFGGITPRAVFAPQYLCHVYRRDTREGPKELDEWMCQPNAPEEGGFWVSDEIATFHHFYTDIFEGPFRDSFSLGQAMQTHDVDRVKVWPESLKMEIRAADIPEEPRDYGLGISPVQPLVRDERLLDWVIYATEAGWLRIGTLTEFKTPRPRNQEIWAGMSAEPIPKKLLAKGFHTYEQALRELCGNLNKVQWRYARRNEPHYYVVGKYEGTEYKLQIARDPRKLVATGRGYNANAEREVLARHGITPRLSFGKQWLVHSKTMGTPGGIRKTDRWMMVTTQPKGNTIAVPDGVGGWFIHTFDKTGGAHQDNYGLARAMKQRGIKSIGLAGGGATVHADWVPERPKDRGEKAPPTRPKIAKVTPEKANQGQKLYVTILGKEIEYGCDLSFGREVGVRDLTWFGKDPKSDNEQWLATLTIGDDAEPGKRNVEIENVDGGHGVGSKLFEVMGVVAELCPFLDLPDTPGNAKAAAARARQKKGIEALKEALKDLHRIEIDLARAKEAAAKVNVIGGEQEHFRVAMLEESRRACHEEKIEKAATEIRKAEEDWLKALRGVGGGVPSSSRAALRALCRERAECVRKRMYERLEALKKVDRALIMALSAEVGTRYQEYATARTDLDSTLRFWGILNHVEVLERERTRDRAARTKQGLAEAQRGLYGAYLERSEWALQTAEMRAITAMEGQRHCWYLLKAVHDKGARTPWMDSIIGDAAQAATQGCHYVLGSFATLWAGFADGFRVIMAEALPDWVGIETQAQKVDGQILKARKENDKKLEYLGSLRGVSEKVLRTWRQGLAQPAEAAFVAQGYSLLLADRNFHEMTDGGLFRLLGAFDATRTERLETEYLAALHHGRLGVRDMQTSLNLEMGRDAATGHFSFKILLDPMKIAYVVRADETGLLATKRLFIEGKRAQVEREMAQLLPRWRKAQYDFDRIAEFLPQNFSHHEDLIWNNEDYCQFYIRVLLYDHAQAMDAIEDRLAGTTDPQVKRLLEGLRKTNQWRLQLALAPYLARSYQLQAQRKIICRDWTGAAAAVEQAVKTNRELAKVINLEEVKDALLWEGVRQSAIDIFHQVGNQAIMAAVNAKIMSFIGPAAAAETMTLGEFLWGQINPFAKVLTTEGAANIVRNAAEGVLQEAVAKGMVERVGIDQKYADFAANLIVGAASKWGEKGLATLRDSLLYSTASDLKDASDEAKQKRPDQDPDLDEARERKALQEDLADLAVVADGESQAQQDAGAYRAAVRKKGAASLEAEQARQKLLDSKSHAEGRTGPPLSEGRVRKWLGQYGKKTGGKFNLRDAVRLFRRLPLSKLRALKREGKLPVELERQVDAVRVQMMDAFQREVCRRAGSDVTALVMTGAAVNPEGPEYVQKMLDSDFDFTFLVRANLPEAKRKAIEALYEQLVGAASKRSPMELADSTGFSDRLNPKYDLEALAKLTERDAQNPERYLNLGATEFILFMNKVGGRLKGFDPETGQWRTLPLEANEKVFGHMKFETWMGADIALEQFRFREAHREHRGEDVGGFLRDQGKYTVRAALARLVSDPDGCARLNALKPQEAIDAGGLHAAIIKAAQEFEGRLFTAGQIALLKQCNALKKGIKPETVFNAQGDAANRAIAEHHKAVGAFFDEVLPTTMKVQQDVQAGLQTASATPEMRDKDFKIMVAQAWALSRMRPDQLQYIARMGGGGRDYTSSSAALDMAKFFRNLPDPPHAEREAVETGP